MKALLVATALIEGGTGLALLAIPSTPALLLFGTMLDTPTAQAVARVAGAALLSIGVSCWLARNDEPNRAAVRAIVPLLLYNISTVAILAARGTAFDLFGVALWPAVILHVAMAAWCVACLRASQV